jgi:hypothetical protein
VFCGKCGNKNEAEMKFCGSCGASIGRIEAEKKAASFVSAKEIVIGPVRVNAPDESNAVITVAGKTLKVSLIFKVASVLLAISFFLPFFSVQLRMFGITAEQSMNGSTAMLGYEGTDGSFMAFFLLLIPIAIFILFHFTKQLEEKLAFIKGKMYLFSTGGFGLGFIVLFLVRNSVTSTFRGNIANSVGFWLTLSLYLIAGAVSVGCLLSAKGVNIRVGAGGNKSGSAKNPATLSSMQPATMEVNLIDKSENVQTSAQALQASQTVKPVAKFSMKIALIIAGVALILGVGAFFIFGGGVGGGGGNLDGTWTPAPGQVGGFRSITFDGRNISIPGVTIVSDMPGRDRKSVV